MHEVWSQEPQCRRTKNAAVILTCNLWQEVSVCNGATGVVEDPLFHSNRPPPCLPIAALVHFANYKGS